jgi:FKBP-type peptidyl-prolyl cis-trans isomerase
MRRAGAIIVAAALCACGQQSGEETASSDASSGEPSTTRSLTTTSPAETPDAAPDTAEEASWTEASLTPDERLAASEAYLAENGARPEVTTTSSGLQYEVLEDGPAGGAHPAIDQPVCVHYRGTFIDGEEFDSSYARNAPIAFAPNQVIPAWTEALMLMKPGDTWRLVVHPDLGYGSRGRPGIPPNSALVFQVELIKLLDTPPPRGADCSKY